MGGRIGLLAFLLLLLPPSFTRPQDKKTVQDARQQPTFRLPVNSIVINATVTDKDGNPVTDLAQNDFKIYEDGKPQPIQTFGLEYYEPVQSEGAPRLRTPVPGRAAASAPNATRPRMVSIVIDDMTAASNGNFPLVARAVARFVEEDVRSEDQVALLAGSGLVQFPFTNDKGILLGEISDIHAKLNRFNLDRSDCPVLTDLQAQKIADQLHDSAQVPTPSPASNTNPATAMAENAERSLQEIQSITDDDLRVAVQETVTCMSLDLSVPTVVETAKAYTRSAARKQSEESDYRASTLLRTLRRHLRTLRHFDAAKSAVIFSDGFLSESVSHISYELQDVVDQALLSGVILNTVDIRSLYTSIVPVTERPTSYLWNTATDKQRLFLSDMAAQETPLARMSNDTGGLFYHNSNDLYDGLRKIARRQSSYYVLTYVMSSQKSDGRYHQIKVELSRPGLEVSYRKGYYAPKEELTFERRKREDILEALQAPGNLNEIPIGLAYNYYQEDDSTYAISLAANISIRGLHFLDEDSRHKNLINLVVAAFDETDHFIDGIEKSIDFKLTEAGYADVLKYGIKSRVEFKLPLGRYKIKAVVREGAEGKMGSTTRAVEIP